MKFHRKLFLGASIFAFTFAAAEARAQGQAAAAAATAAAPAAPAEIEEIVVTGTHIAGLAKNTTVAVDVVSAADLAARGSPSPIELMKSLPYVTGGVNGDNSFSNQSVRYAGAANINLRGLSNAATNGFDRTLVLFNGQRMAPFALTNISETDVNSIPMAAVSRIETLKNGGSTAYGSDAIAGVVNFITAKNLNGFKVGADYQAIRGSGGNWNGHVNWGKVFDRGNVLLSLGYNHTSELTVQDRSWAFQPLLNNPQTYLSTSNPGVYTVATAAAGLGANKSFLDPGCSALGGTQSPLNGPSGAPICYQSRSPYQNLIDKSDRVQLYGELNYEIAENTKLHVEGWYTQTSIPDIRYAPVAGAPQNFPTMADNGGLATGVLPASTVFPGQATAFYVPAGNPGLKDLLTKYSATQLGLTQAQYNFALTNGLNTGSGWQALGLGGNPGAGGGSTKINDQFKTYRISGGIDGAVLKDINWTTRFTASEYDIANQYPDLIVQRAELALRGLGGPNCNVAANTPGQNGCLYFNPFSTGFAANGYSGVANPSFVGHANDPALVNWMMDPNEIASRSRLLTAEGGLNGKLNFFTLPGGPISWAAGVQYRWNELRSEPRGFANSTLYPCTDAGVPASVCSPNLSGPLAVFGVRNTLQASQSSTGEYVEFHLPITSRLELQLAGRHESDSAGNVTNDPKFALRWQATDFLAFRASREATFKAPLPLQLDTSNPATATTPVGLTRVQLVTLGNPSLKPETATSYDFGVILNPGGLIATVDYWSYTIANQITTENPSNFVSSMFPSALGQNGHCGDSAYAKLQAKFGFNGSCSLNNISRVINAFINGPVINTSGIDIDISYKHSLWDGQITLATNATRVLNFSQADQYLAGTPILVLASYNQVGKFNGGGANSGIVSYGRPIPAWRDMTSINYAIGRHNFRWTTHYTDGVTDNRFGFGGSIDPLTAVAGYPPGTIVTAGATIDSTITHDITYGYTTKGGWQINFAVTNIFDKAPPFARTDLSYAQDMSSPLGRVIRLGFEKSF